MNVDENLFNVVSILTKDETEQETNPDEDKMRCRNSQFKMITKK